MGYYLAIDIGTSEGHHFLGHLENEMLKVEEVYRFHNTTDEKEVGHNWDLLYLFNEITAGLKKCREIGKLPIFVGIDTRLTDFVLLDDEDEIIVRENHSDYREKVKTLLMIPDYFNFLLTGVKLSEYTMAAAAQLVSPLTETWNEEKIKELGYSPDIFQELRRPGTVLGTLTREVTEKIGYDCIIVLPATYALSSAMFAFPPKDTNINSINVNLNNVNPNNGSELRSLKDASGDEKEYSAAAVGNLLVQMIISHELKDVQAAHKCVQNSHL